jgi:hypothetical protein
MCVFTCVCARVRVCAGAGVYPCVHAFVIVLAYRLLRRRDGRDRADQRRVLQRVSLTAITAWDALQSDTEPSVRADVCVRAWARGARV